MHYEVVSRALAYVSCLSTLSLFATSVAIAAANVGSARPAAVCPPHACLAGVWFGNDGRSGLPIGASQMEKVSTQPWSAKG